MLPPRDRILPLLKSLCSGASEEDLPAAVQGVVSEHAAVRSAALSALPCVPLLGEGMPPPGVPQVGSNSCHKAWDKCEWEILYHRKPSTDTHSSPLISFPCPIPSVPCSQLVELYIVRHDPHEENRAPAEELWEKVREGVDRGRHRSAGFWSPLLRNSVGASVDGHHC